MKKYYSRLSAIVVVIIFSFYNEPANAQSNFGVKGGALYSNFKSNYNENLIDFDWQSGYSIGAYYNKKNLLGPIGFQAELLYQRKGAIEKISAEDLYGYFDDANALWRIHKKHLHYLSSPLLLTYSALKNFEVYTGAELGILLGATGDNARIEDYNRFSVGMAFGAALKLGKNTKLDFRYSTDFVRVAEMGMVNSKNRGFSVTVQQSLFSNY